MEPRKKTFKKYFDSEKVGRVLPTFWKLININSFSLDTILDLVYGTCVLEINKLNQEVFFFCSFYMQCSKLEVWDYKAEKDLLTVVKASKMCCHLHF